MREFSLTDADRWCREMSGRPVNVSQRGNLAGGKQREKSRTQFDPGILVVPARLGGGAAAVEPMEKKSSNF